MERKFTEVVLLNGHSVQSETTGATLLMDEYFDWKEKQQKSQKSTIASLHYKINLLSDQFHKWRLYTIHRRVVTRMEDVARIHYEETLVETIFLRWKKRALVRKEKERLKVLKCTFFYWRNMTLLKRVSCQRKVQLAKGFYHNVLLKKMFQMWKEKHDYAKADNLWQMHQKRRVLKLWQLQYLKRKIQRRLARAQYRKVMQRNFFISWKRSYEEKEDRRCFFIRKLNVVMLKIRFKTWKRYSLQQKNLRCISHDVEQRAKMHKLRYCVHLWKWKLDVRLFCHRHAHWKTRFLERKYFFKWRNKVRMKKLNTGAMNFAKRQHEILIEGCFRRWISQKEKELLQREEEELLKEVLNKRTVVLHFYHWRLFTQQELLIQPLLLSIHQKILTRCFTAWLEWTKFRRKPQYFRRRCDKQNIRKIFLEWRARSEQITCERRLKIKKEKILIRKCLDRWNEFVSFKKSYRNKRVEYFARHWLDVTQQNKIEREISKAEQTNKKLLERAYFFKWLHQAQNVQHRRKRLEVQADSFCNERILFVALQTWTRQYEMRHIVREFLTSKKFAYLKKVFLSWLRYTRCEIDHQIKHFNQRFDSSINRHSNYLSIKGFNETGAQTFFSPVAIHSSSLLQEVDGNVDQSFNSSGCQASYPLELATSFSISRRESMDSVPTQDRLLLQGFIYDSDYEMDGTFSSEEKSEIQQTFDSEQNNDKCPVFVNVDLSDLKSCSDNPLSWTDHWKRRYVQSQEAARLRRLYQSNHPYENLCVDGAAEPLAMSSRPYSRESIKSSQSLYPRPSEFLNRSFPFVRQHSMDDPHTSGVYSFDDDVLSVASSCQSKNKALLLVGTINYWRNHNVGTVFYAWLKYVARKKFLRQGEQHLMVKKNQFLLHTMFLKWNRHLYGIQASTDLVRRHRKKRCFKQWEIIKSFQRLKKERNLKATTTYRCKSLRKSINAWKNKYNMKRCLNDIAKTWMDTITINASHEQRLEQHRNTWDERIKKKLFSKWRDEWNKSKMADQHYAENLINRVLNVWWCQVLVKENIIQKIKSFQMNHLVAKMFRRWQQKQLCFRQLNVIQQRKQVELTRQVFSCWLQWTQASVKKEDVMYSFIQRRNCKLQNDALVEWKVSWRQQMVATQHYNDTLCKNVLFLWCWRISVIKENRDNLEQFTLKRRLKLVRKNFDWWKSSTEASKQYRIKVIESLRFAFLKWRKFCLQEKSASFHTRHTTRKYYKRWKDSFVCRKKEITMMKHSSKRWLAHIHVTQQHEKNMEILLHRKQEILLNKTFIQWNHQANISLKAKRFNSQTISKRVIFGWLEHTKECRSRKTSLLTYQHKCNTDLLSSTFFLWKNAMIKTLKLKAIKINLIQFSVRRMAREWRLNVRAQKFEKYRQEVSQRRLFEIWHHNYCLEKKANEFCNRLRMKRSFLSLKTYMERQKKSSILVGEFERLKAKQMVSLFFKKWRMEEQNVVRQRKIEKDNLQTAKCHYEKKLLDLYFKQWSTYVVLLKLKKKRSDKLCRKYARKWLDLVAMTHLADSIYQQNILNQTWMSWRKEYILNKVVKHFVQQERRKIMSAVFVTWFDYTRRKGISTTDSYDLES